MNFFELADQLRSDCGISGSESTTANAAGEWKDVTRWVNRAWKDIQLQYKDWLWMRKAVSFQTIAEQAEYPIDAAPLMLTDFAKWVDDSFRIYKDTLGNELPLTQWYDYDNFRDTWQMGTLRLSYSQPTDIVVSPSKSLILALPPNDDTYTIIAHYQQKPQKLLADTDVPEMPEDYHDLIVFKAIEYAGYKESASELLAMSQKEYRRMMNRLEIDQLPRLTVDRSQ